MSDVDLLESAKNAAAELLESDPTLEKPENAVLAARLEKLLREAAL